MLQRDVEKVSAAAGGVEHGRRAEFLEEAAHERDRTARRVDLAFVGQQQRGGLDVGPVFAQRRDDRGQHETFDVCARRVVRAESVAFGVAEGLLQERAENGGFDFAPVGTRGGEQRVDVFLGEREGVRRLEKLAVELQHVDRERGAETADVHVVPERGHHAGERWRIRTVRFDEGFEAAFGQQFDVFGEHRKQATREKPGDRLGAVARAF